AESSRRDDARAPDAPCRRREPEPRPVRISAWFSPQRPGAITGGRRWPVAQKPRSPADRPQSVGPRSRNRGTGERSTPHAGAAHSRAGPARSRDRALPAGGALLADPDPATAVVHAQAAAGINAGR